MVAVHERLGQDEPGLVCRGERLLDLRRATRVGLLAEDVLARGEGMHRPLVVHPVRERDVDGVDVVVGEERLVRGVGALDPVLGRVRLGLRAVAAADRDDVDEVRLGGAAKDLLVDVRRRQQAESHARSSFVQVRSGTGGLMCGGGAGGTSDPAPVAAIASSIARRVSSPSASSAAAAQPST